MNCDLINGILDSILRINSTKAVILSPLNRLLNNRLSLEIEVAKLKPKIIAKKKLAKYKTIEFPMVLMAKFQPRVYDCLIFMYFYCSIVLSFNG